VVGTERLPVDWLPLVDLAPTNVPPDAVHEVAFVELQISVELWPPATLVGLAFKVAVGMVPMVTVAVATPLVPPGPVQVNE
jgi:hypothetical protein